jgi:glycosyltransferase involved in cell wall biosynthesis
MREIRELTVFSHGDSRQLSTWSNVPYFFTRTLEAKGIRVHRVNINPPSRLEHLYDNTIWRVLNKALPGGFFTKYLHTGLNHWLTQRRIRQAVREFGGSDAFIFLSFSHSSKGLSSAPVVLFCDWTIDYYFSYFLNRKPRSFERAPLRRQDRVMEEADLVISLFPGVTDYLRTYYRNNNIVYLGNVVNSELSVTPSEVIERKLASKDLLFIGNRKYVEGANCLIQAYQLLKADDPEMKCHIIGMEAKYLENVPDGVTCYGYLDKAKDDQRDLYYSLLQNAKVIVNTTPKWGAFSSTIEAMHFYNPVITSPYKEFVQTFGGETAFGHYCEEGNAQALYVALKELFRDPGYEKMCRAAHDAVKPFTWDSYMERVMEKIRGL